MATETLRQLLLEAVRHFADVGYTDKGDLEQWLIRLHAAIERELPTDSTVRRALVSSLQTIYKRDIERLAIQKVVPGVDRYTLARIDPYLRAELDRRIFAGIDLIKLNRAAAVRKTLQRFSGWVTSAPPGGLKADARKVARHILAPTKQTKYEARRVAIDQGHKLSANVAAVVAIGQGAIAAIWHDRGEHDRGYDARPEHLARSGKMFLIRDSWAIEQGLVRRGALAYTDEIEAPSFLPYCSCYFEYIVSPGRLPPDILTKKGQLWVRGAQVRADAVAREWAEPSTAQVRAGNYPMEHRRLAGLDITIENPKGSIRRGTFEGREWAVTMRADYGYLRRTVGADGDHLDCYLGPDLDAQTVWVIEQRDLIHRGFDEHKVMLGFRTRDDALACYLAGYHDGRGWERLTAMHQMPIGDFVRLVRDEPNWRRPLMTD